MKKSCKHSQVDCLGMGILPLDFLYHVERLPAAGEKIDALDCCLQGGGPVPNALIGLARLGMRTALIAVIGNDPMGRISLDQLAKEKIDSRLVMTKNKPSAVAVGFVEAGTGRRTIALYRKIGIKPRDLKTSTYPVPRVLHLDGRDLEAAMKMARWGKKVGALISFDIGSIRNDVSPILPLVDHLVVADVFAFPFTGAVKAEQAVRRLKEHCLGTIVITEGTSGATGYEKGDFVRQPAFKVVSVDTTGAGDSFHAGYLFGLLNGFNMAKRLKFGAATAALKCTRPGARAGAPTLRRVRDFLRSNPPTYA